MLDKLIRDNLITAPMATSLMNDSGYAYDVARNLVEMGGTLFSTHDINLKNAANSLALDDDELNKLAKQQAN
jgi:phosphate:Na+ symporter